MSWSRLIDALKQSGRVGPAINDGFAQAQALKRRAVEHAAPFPFAAAVELFRVLLLQQRFRFSVSGLLPQISHRRLAPVMPYERARRKSDPAPFVLQPPADIHVVAGLPIQRIEAIDGQQG